MRNGIFGLFSLDGAPINDRDRAAAFGGFPQWGPEAPMMTPGAMVAARDRSGAGVHLHRDAEGLAVLLGDLDEAADVAARLGLAQATSPAALAVAARARWGREAPLELAGEWLLLRWDEPSRALTLMAAQGAHEHCHVASDGRRVAVAPDLVRLARLPWVDAAFDPDMLMRSMGRAHLRRSMAARTILRGVTRVTAGATVTIARRGVRVEAPTPRMPPPLVRIGFDDAVAELDALLRRIVRARLARAGGIAVEMSGGLDSSLMGLLAAEERGADQRLVFLTSAAPSGSGLEDETGWAATVARHLDVPLIPVSPGVGADIYRPSPRTLAIAERPGLTPHHYLFEAFVDAAVASGATRIVDGSFGEMTLSNHGDHLGVRQRPSPRALIRDLLDRWRLRTTPTRSADYHVMPAPGALAARDAARALRPRSLAPRRLADDAAFGFEQGVEWVGQLPTTTVDAHVRALVLLRDPRLIRLMASFPAGHVRHDGVGRAPIRALLRDRLPPAVVTRPKSGAFSPTHDALLRDQAAAAIALLPDQRRAAADDWLDLDWLEATLSRVAGGERLPRETMIRVQGTANAAAFLAWWPVAARSDD